ncbi:hypothetical protein HAX54_044947 [Datura stramonium]|uniref:Uncharacterized protein n=1 Tax=Datura stramonium TaxID=4076 RepID=A0ABS8SQ67_DATST|nr:hypothetical protein [Datura stramonium]
MVYLSIEDETKELYLFINSPGGWVMMHQPGTGYYRAQVGEFILEAAEPLNCVKPSQGFMYKDGQTYGLYPKIWKEMFLCQQQKPKLMELLILQLGSAFVLGTNVTGSNPCHPYLITAQRSSNEDQLIQVKLT